MTGSARCRRGWRRRSLMILLAGALAGCAPLFGGRLDPITYHALKPTVDGRAAAPVAAGGMIALQTVRLPEYLNQRGIVTRNRLTEVAVADDSQWAGSLANDMTNVVATNLATLLPGRPVTTFPVNPALPIDRVVQVDVTRFDGQPAGDVVLDAQWLVFADGGRRFVGADGRRYTVPTADDGIPAIVDAMSEAVGQLSRDVAETLSGRPSVGRGGALSRR